MPSGEELAVVLYPIIKGEVVLPIGAIPLSLEFQDGLGMGGGRRPVGVWVMVPRPDDDE